MRWLSRLLVSNGEDKSLEMVRLPFLIARAVEGDA
jgi:hypothetical protein